LLFAEYPKKSESILLTGDTLFRGNVGRLDCEYSIESSLFNIIHLFEVINIVNIIWVKEFGNFFASYNYI
jgi:hypothetical protein